MSEAEEWEPPEVDMEEAVAQLSEEGKKEWELAAQRAIIARLTEECQSMFQQIQILEGKDG